ncbi:SAM-dependent MidA family methyltransferase [Breoghania corrubedonensis]|uniref:SAM-dependent MidA family methyltransferase n=1 Tax=Breoghania corrubedonensis TaxID=665038 RepID=A0A2T5UNX0_9HYPH|nr:class I SAM-dependent methyltransferase [Breoghania corrubedonensis]PTW53193.1 SAM-dependent MidA family methyltransferase [Breoghania corrubedonensis]
MSETPLKARIRALVEKTGPISVADYMGICLADPEHGYYMRREPFGAKGDFTTAPEVSQIFGELIGAWSLETWAGLGRPAPVNLVELGPGRGTLMADMLRVARLDPGFCAAARVHLVETSPRLRTTQEETLAGAPLPVTWHENLASVPQGPMVLVANEFFDALPIHQYVLTQGSWHERVVGLDPARDDLAFAAGPGRLDTVGLDGRIANPGAHGVGDGAILETQPLANAIAMEISTRLRQGGGGALVIDYGYERTEIGDTLQALERHTFADPLAHPGEADITAHVNFEALARAAREAGAAPHGPMTQGDFLIALGLLERAGHLGAGKDTTVQERIRDDVERLAGPDQMGTLFKVLALTSGCATPRPFPN